MQEVNTFTAPIAGQSLTTEPKGYAWERPPEMNEVSDVMNFYITRLGDQRVMDDVFTALDNGFPLSTMVDSILGVGVMEGMHTVDVSMVVAPVLHEYILGAAKIQKIKVKEFPETKDSQIDAKEKRALAATVERSLEKSPKEDTGKALLEEALSFVQEDAPMAEGGAMDAPEEVASEEKPMGLMSRRDT